MTQYIDKSILVEKIEKRIKETESMDSNDPFWAGQISGFDSVLKMLDTLEVKVIDLEEKIKNKINDISNL